MTQTIPPRDMFMHERSVRTELPSAVIAGVDEAGRGPLAGPVVAAAVILPAAESGFSLPVNDSKKLTALQRRKLDLAIRGDGRIFWSICYRTPGEIDRVNILRATHEAMRECICRLLNPPEFRPEDSPFSDPEKFPLLSAGPIPRPDIALVDGLRVPDFPVSARFIVQGDGQSASIAAASILAKTWRDRYMEELDRQYPQYGFKKHKGYGTAAHYEALRRHGPCPEHRQSFTLFKPVPPEQPTLPLF